MTKTDSSPLINKLEALSEADTGVILHELNQRALLVDLTVKQWEGRHQIEGAEIQLGGKSLPKNLTSQSHWVLRPKNWAERFNQMAGILRGFMQPKVQPKRGIDIIALKDAPRIFQSVKEYRESTWNPAVEEFVGEWADISARIYPDLVKHFSAGGAVHAELAESLAREVYHQLSRHIPTQAGLQGKFGVQLEVFPLGDSLSAVRDGLAGEHAEEFVKEMEQATRAFANQVMLDIMSQPLEEAAAVANSIIQKMHEGKGGLREESIGVMRRALEKVKSFSDFVARPQLLSAIKKAETTLSGYSHEELNNSLRNKTLVAASLGAAFQEINNEVELAQTSVKRFGRKLRSVEF